MARKCIEIIDSLRGQYSVDKNVRFKTPMLRSNLCDYTDAYITVKGRISVEGINPVNRRNKRLTLKNISPFRSCKSIINNTLTDNAENPDIVMPMYNLLEYSDNYSMT